MSQASSSDGTLDLIERGARRWATAYATLLEAGKSGFSDALLIELRAQGWLPASKEELNEWSPHTLAHLGRGLGYDAAAAFLPVLTNVFARKLLDCSTLSHNAGVLAATPYWNFRGLHCAGPSVHVTGNLLDGKLPMVVHPQGASLLVVVARDSGRYPAIATVPGIADKVMLHEPHATLGLRGPTIRTVEFDSVEVLDLISGDSAREAIEDATRFLSWGAIGLLAGIVAKASNEAATYAQLRIQGGRRIAEHGAVERLLEVTRRAQQQFEIWIDRLSSEPTACAPLVDARSAALNATDAALQVFGGGGYICPSIGERCWRDARQAAVLCSS